MLNKIISAVKGLVKLFTGCIRPNINDIADNVVDPSIELSDSTDDCDTLLSEFSDDSDLLLSYQKLLLKSYNSQKTTTINVDKLLEKNMHELENGLLTSGTNADRFKFSITPPSA